MVVKVKGRLVVKMADFRMTDRLTNRSLQF